MRTHTQRVCNPNATVKMVSKSQEKTTKEGGKKKDLKNPKRLRNGHKYILIHHYVECKWTKCSN